MSGYFVHGGTQYPFNQNQNQPQASSNNQQSFYGSTSYPSSQTGVNQNNQFSSMSSGGGNSSGNFQSNTGGFNNSQSFNSNTGSSNNFGGGSNNFNSSNSSYSGSNYGAGNSGGGNKFGGSSYNFNKGSSGNSGGNYGGGFQSNQSSYEKALFNAANQYYSNKPRGRGRGGFGRGRGGGRGGFNQQARQPQNTGPKPIKASEIKAFLYAWCGQRKMKPEYEITTEGEHPKKVTFSCALKVSGLDCTAQVEAASKKDAQTKAAWSLCESLVQSGYMKQSELPPKPVEPAPKTASGETSQPVGSLPPETAEVIHENGGWTLANSRQRLNQFCQREHSTPIFKHTTHGPEHARSFSCELTMFIDSLQKEFMASETGTNKKQSTAICALSMVRQLFKANLIERQGEPIKHVSRGGLLGSKSIEPKQEIAEAEGTSTAVAPGQKRKAEEPLSVETVDENGNWTVDNSRQRLNQFCQTHNIPCDVIYEEEGGPGNRTYTASLNLKVKPIDEVEEQELTAKATGQSKKIAAQGCALSLLGQLFKLSLVEANPSGSNGPNKKKQLRQRLDQPMGLPMQMVPFMEYPAVSAGPMFGRHLPVRKTFNADIHLNEKHKQIYPSEHELNVVQRTVRTLEQGLKEVAEQLVDSDGGSAAAADEKKMETDEKESEPKKKSKLQGVVRVGALSKGLLLRGDMHVQLVLLCHEAPTAKLLVRVAQLLPKFIKASEGDTFSVVTAMHDAAISVTNTTLKTENDPSLSCHVTISLTSPVIRTPSEEAAKDPPGALNKDKCLQALAELRHSKWFQACANGLPSCVIIIRILRYLSRNVKEWKPMSDWALELLVEKALATTPVAQSLGSSFQRCMEVLASGILLPGGPGIADPCERVESDVAGHLTASEAEALTHAAQVAIRKIVYRQIYEILGIDQLEPIKRYKKPFAAKELGQSTEGNINMES